MYLGIVLEQGDPKLFQSALEAIVRSKGMAPQVAAEANRSLPRARTRQRPGLSTLRDILKALGLRMSVVEATPANIEVSKA